MSRHRLAASMLLLAICALAFAVESPSRDSAYRYSDVFTVNADGSGLRNLTRKYLGRDDYPALSPDGRTLVFERERIAGGYGWSGLALMPSRGGRGRDLIRIPDGNAWRPAWSRDGAFVAFTGCYDPCNVRGVGVVRRDGSGLKWIPDASDPTWLSGRRIAFLTEFDGQRAQAIGVTKADGTGRSIVARTSDVAASMFFRPSASPDGTTIAFSAYGPTYLRWPLYVVNVNRGSAPRLIAPSGSDATWAPSGRRLAFYDSNSLWTVRVDGSRLRRLWHPPNPRQRRHRSTQERRPSAREDHRG